jgi:ABC-type dipeptide/oligopeptide/nickel transport system permease component
MSLMLPGFVLGTGAAGTLVRCIRSSLLEVLGQD